MARVSDRELPEKTEDLVTHGFKETIKSLGKEEDAQGFLYNFLTPQEQTMLAKRFAVGVLASQGMHYRKICNLLKVTPNTVQTVKREMQRSGRFRKLLEIIGKKSEYQKLLHSEPQNKQN